MPAGAAMSTADMSAPLVRAPDPDPRVGLKAGLQDAGSAIWNLRMVSHVPSPPGFATITNSDLAFHKQSVIQGNYNGFEIWDISNPGVAAASHVEDLPGVAERRLGLSEPALRVGRKRRRRVSTAARKRRARPVSKGAHPRLYASSTSPTSTIRNT
jgi:hypothetical protein